MNSRCECCEKKWYVCFPRKNISIEIGEDLGEFVSLVQDVYARKDISYKENVDYDIETIKRNLIFPFCEPEDSYVFGVISDDRNRDVYRSGYIITGQSWENRRGKIFLFDVVYK